MDAHEVLAAEVAALLPATRPVLLGISGGVGVGKSTMAAGVRDRLTRDSVATEILCTDAFLLPNEELERRDLSMRKGFPESFDNDALDAALHAVKERATAVQVPVYSHTTYDRVPGTERTLDPADVLIIEGVNALQPPVADHLDVAVYIDAAEADIEAWFVDRFLAFCEEAVEDERSFYRGFTAMSAAQQRGIAEWTWREINGVNLRDHIAPSRARATVVLSKRRDHSISPLP
jgi:type I pantothenate kinase